MKIKLVEDWREWYKWWSTWLAAASAAFGGAAVAYASLPAAWQILLPNGFGYFCGLGAVITAALVPAVRVLQQPHLAHLRRQEAEDDTDSAGC